LRERRWIRPRRPLQQKRSSPGSNNGENSNKQMTSAGYRSRFAARHSLREKSDVRAKIRSRFIAIASICCALSVATWLGVQLWPSHAPQDYEECSERAGKAASSKDERASLIDECDRQFIGRRKPGGGYAYYDFLQNRRFDIAGPNPTPKEQKSFDEEYIVFLNAQRRDAITAALAEKQRLRAEAAFQNDQASANAAIPLGAPLVITPNNVPIPGTGSQAARSKAQRCDDASLSCSWTKFSAGIKNIFGVYAKVNRP
jgi:hypothetical protein